MKADSFVGQVVAVLSRRTPELERAPRGASIAHVLMRRKAASVHAASSSSPGREGRDKLRTMQGKRHLRATLRSPRQLDTRATLPDPDAPGGGQATAVEVSYVPLVGRIAAGGPILAEERVEDVLALPRQLVGEGTFFVLQVVGDSMIDVAIADGDLVVVRQQGFAEQGDIVAAMIDGEATIKTFMREHNRVWLMPQNAAFEPISGDEASILGRVVLVLRRV